MHQLTPPWCDLCGAPTLWPVARCRECSGRKLAFTTARAAVAYTGPVRPLVAAWKERGLRRAAHLAAELVIGNVSRPSVEAIAYVPSDPDRVLRRGAHPAEQLARALSTRWELELVRVLERRRGATRTRQAGLSRELRMQNVRNAFVARGTLPLSLALVDDVYTTGATVGAAAAALRRAGVDRIEVVTFARTVRD
jgi:predicted amidophosphoribosyltransferase